MTQHIADTDLIFYGIVEDVIDLDPNDKERNVEFRVLRVYKGVEGDRVRIRYFDHDRGFSGWGFKRHEPALIFAHGALRASDGVIVGRVGHCSMMAYHRRLKLQPDYLDALIKLNQ